MTLWINLLRISTENKDIGDSCFEKGPFPAQLDLITRLRGSIQHRSNAVS
jgi:hypothetical protein